MGYVLGIDLGTTGIKAIIFDRESNILGIGLSELPLIFPEPGWVEQDPAIMWKSVVDSVSVALSISKIKKEEILSVGIAHQGESVMAWDSADGKPFYNNILWQDRRTSVRCDELKLQVGLSQEITKKTGLLIDPFFSSTKIEWLLQNVSDISRRLKEKRVRVGTLDSWMIWMLSGGKSFLTDYTSASRTMLFNLKGKYWDEDLLRLFSIPVEILAEPKPSSYFFGMTDPNNFLGIVAPITGAVVDTQGALFGQVCFEKGDIKNTYGTSCVIQLNIGEEPVLLKNGLTTTVALSFGDTVDYAAEGIIYISGAAVQWLRDGLEIISNAAESEQMAKSVEDTMGVYFIPAFVGLAAPYWDYRTRGTIVGLTRGVRKEHIVRATLESIAYQVKDVVDLMERETGVSVRELKVDGGAVKNAFLMQFQADILGIPVIVPKVTETTCLGAAYISGLQVGFWKNLKEIKQNWKMEKIYTPSMERAKVDELYGGWSRAVRGAISIYK